MEFLRRCEYTVVQRAIPILCIRSSWHPEEMKIVEVERCCVSSIQTLLFLFDSSLCAASASHFSIQILLMHMFTSSDTCLTLSSFYLSEHVIVVNRNYDLLDLRMSSRSWSQNQKCGMYNTFVPNKCAWKKCYCKYHGGLDFRYHWDNALYASPCLMDENETEMGESQWEWMRIYVVWHIRGAPGSWCILLLTNRDRMGNFNVPCLRVHFRIFSLVWFDLNGALLVGIEIHSTTFSEECRFGPVLRVATFAGNFSHKKCHRNSQHATSC